VSASETGSLWSQPRTAESRQPVRRGHAIGRESPVISDQSLCSMPGTAHVSTRHGVSPITVRRAAARRTATPGPCSKALRGSHVDPDPIPAADEAASSSCGIFANEIVGQSTLILAGVLQLVPRAIQRIRPPTFSPGASILDSIQAALN
jgi:hypothetical protein